MHRPACESYSPRCARLQLDGVVHPSTGAGIVVQDALHASADGALGPTRAGWSLT